MHPVDQKFIVQMWAGSRTGGANRSDDLSLRYPLPRFHFAFIQVQILGDVLFSVLDENVVAIGAAVSCSAYAAISGREYGSPCGCCVISSSMRTGSLVDRMQAPQVKVGADPCEVDRGHEEGFAHTDAFLVVIVGIAIAIGEAKRIKKFRPGW